MTDQLSAIPKPVKTQHHLGQAVSLKGLKADMQKVDGLNAKIAVFVTNIVGSMWCAYLFCLIAIVAWIAQTFIQLVLLSVIMVGQNVQSIASDARSEHTYEDTVKIIDALNMHTDGGIKDLHDSLVEYIDDKFKSLSTT